MPAPDETQERRSASRSLLLCATCGSDGGPRKTPAPRPLATGLASREALAPLDLRRGRLVEFHRPAVDVACSFVGFDRDAGFRDLAIEELQSGGDRAVTEAALAAADHHGEDPHAELVDQVVLEQRLDEARAAVNLDLGAVLAL